MFRLLVSSFGFFFPYVFGRLCPLCSMPSLGPIEIQRIHENVSIILETPEFSHYPFDTFRDCKFFNSKTPDCEEKCVLSGAATHDVFNLGGFGKLNRMQPKRISCNDPNKPDFWKDFCTTDSGDHIIDLHANVEKNTGYNGSAIWDAMYRENCLVDKLDQCVEQKFMYRLLSGLQSSTNIAIAKRYLETPHGFKPSLKRYFRDFPRPDSFYSQNLRFTFNFLFSVFHESKGFFARLFPENSLQFRAIDGILHEDTVCALIPVESGIESPYFELKKIFTNVTSLVDCVQCQSCRLYAKLALHGFATALKIRALSRQVTATPSLISRDELTAYFHTMSMFSRSLREELEFERQREDYAVEMRRAAMRCEPSMTTYDVIVVGSGLAGMTAALKLSDRGLHVLVLEKQAFLGGNSAKASSGVNLWVEGDSSFLSDTLKSAKSLGDPDLMEILIRESPRASEFIADIGVDLDPQPVKLGGHSRARTYRPREGFVGMRLTSQLIKLLRSRRNVDICMNTSVQSLEKSQEGVEGVKISNGQETWSVQAQATVLASGGFTYAGQDSVLANYRPDLLKFPATTGDGTTGDGIRMGLTLGAQLRDMDQIQVHPTGFIDPEDPENRNKVLAAEILRGVGGILVDAQGRRFANELGTRAEIVEAMLAYEDHRFFLVIDRESTHVILPHIGHYLEKDLLRTFDSLSHVYREHQIWLGSAVATYNLNKSEGQDPFGKLSFPGNYFGSSPFLVGLVTPVLHYSMGGLKVDLFSQVLDDGSRPIPNLYAIGEQAGGVHGGNRLAGNSLLECLVFGVRLAANLPANATTSLSIFDEARRSVEEVLAEASQIKAPFENTSRCIMVLHNMVFDFTDYADKHPGGKRAIIENCGHDATLPFKTFHTRDILDDFIISPEGGVEFLGLS